MGQVAKQIIGSFEDIGKDIAEKVVNAPKDILGQALENMGAGSQKSQKSQTPQIPQTPQTPQPEKKPAVPREWLEELAGRRKKQPEPSVQERLEQEKLAQKEKAAKEAPKMAPLPVLSTKPKRGNLFGSVKQRSSAEMSKNVRQD